MSNVVMETATVSATRTKEFSSATTASMTTPTTTSSEISNKYYGSNDVMEQEQEQQEQQEEEQEEVEKQTMDSVVKDNSYLQKLNGEWKRDDQLDESKLMDLTEMNQLFREAANSGVDAIKRGRVHQRVLAQSFVRDHLNYRIVRVR